MSVCCVLSDRGLCDELITRPDESYGLWCVDVCDLEKITFVNEDEGQDPLWGYRAKRGKKNSKKGKAIAIVNLASHAVNTHRAISEGAARKGRLKERCGLEPLTKFLFV